MLSTVPMTRLDALVLRRHARSALAGLAEEGSVELAASGLSLPAAQAAPAGLAEAEDRLARIKALRAALGAPRAYNGACADGLEEIEAAAAVPLACLRELLKEQERIAAELAALAPYAGLELPSTLESPLLYFAAGSLPEGAAVPLPPGAVRAGTGAFAGRVYYVFIAEARLRPQLDAALASAGFQRAAPPSRTGLTFAALDASLRESARRTDGELAAARRALDKLTSRCGTRLAELEAEASAYASLLEAEASLPATAGTALISGWVPGGQAAAAAGRIAAASGGACAVETRRAAPGEDAPVLLAPPRLLRPFAALVGAYGLPRYGEADPTPFAAVTYLLMFGMMFGDAGHGAVVCLGGLWLARRGGRLRDAGFAAAACGLSAMLFGLVYGSFFGLESFRHYALWRDPLEGDPLALPLAAVACGAAVITAGVLLNIFNRFRTGDRLGAALGRFGAAGLAFYWGGLLSAAGVLPWRAGLALLLGGAACWAALGPARKLLGGGESWEETAAEAAVGTFEGALLYLANTVSFVRLAAYAMSHAALTAASYMLAGAADKIWGQGSIAGLAAVVIGNAAAIGLEGLVAAVQALRLEYYEFFGKFLEGAGRPFRPFPTVYKGEK